MAVYLFIRVSIHAPARGATVVRPINSYALAVSIHAPARGATKDEPIETGVRGVSIHAPARGATITDKAVTLAKMFQSTHPRGVRLVHGTNGYTSGSVSIHAPARGATRLDRGNGSDTGVSIHAPARGATPDG